MMETTTEAKRLAESEYLTAVKAESSGPAREAADRLADSADRAIAAVSQMEDALDSVLLPAEPAEEASAAFPMGSPLSARLHGHADRFDEISWRLRRLRSRLDLP